MKISKDLSKPTSNAVYLPRKERLPLDYGGLYDLLRRENTPGDCISIYIGDICAEVALGVRGYEK